MTLGHCVDLFEDCLSFWSGVREKEIQAEWFAKLTQNAELAPRSMASSEPRMDRRCSHTSSAKTSQTLNAGEIGVADWLIPCALPSSRRVEV